MSTHESTSSVQARASTSASTVPSSASSAERTLRSLLATVDIRVNGDRPWDLQVHTDQLYNRLLAGGRLAAGETYMDGWWDCEALDAFFFRVLRANLHEALRTSPRFLWDILKAKLFNLQSPSRAYRVGEQHYDRGNDLYEAMLDRRMTYSCGYWAEADTLDEAQEAKLDLLCQMLELEPGHRVLDVGCGWGSFLQYAAETYGVEGVGITVSEEQVRRARERCAALPVEIRLQDYRDLDGTFDRIVSVGMLEHVGPKNYRTFMETMKAALKDNGLLLLQSIGSSTSTSTAGPWINKYIFPNGVIPSARQLATAAEGLWVMEAWRNIGPHYDPTLMAWHRNVEAHWDALKDAYDGRFRRMWRYYLLASAGNFRARRNQVWQILYSHDGRLGSRPETPPADRIAPRR